MLGLLGLLGLLRRSHGPRQIRLRTVPRHWEQLLCRMPAAVLILGVRPRPIKAGQAVHLLGPDVLVDPAPRPRRLREHPEEACVLQMGLSLLDPILVVPHLDGPAVPQVEDQLLLVLAVRRLRRLVRRVPEQLPVGRVVVALEDFCS